MQGVFSEPIRPPDQLGERSKNQRQDSPSALQLDHLLTELFCCKFQLSKNVQQYLKHTEFDFQPHGRQIAFDLNHESVRTPIASASFWSQLSGQPAK